MAADGSVIIEIDGDDSKFSDKLNNLARGAVKGLTSALAGAATATTALAGASVKVGSSFEASMSQVAATMGITTDEIAAGSESFDLLSQAAKDAGATTAFSASQASEALNYLALAGYDAQTAADALPAVLNLAAAGNMDLAYASDLATDAMAALGIAATQDNLTQFGDQMARTASKANTSVAQLGEAILTVGGTAKSLAGGTTELNAALGVLANRGIKGAEGGTALRNIILALSAPTDKAAKTMEALGLNVYDATGNLRPLNEVFRDLDAAMAGLGEGEKTQILNEIFNKVDLKSAQALLAGCGEEFDNLADAIANSGGAMQNMADTQLDNLQGDLTILKSGLEGLGISAYESLQGPLRETVQMATELVGEIAAAFTEGGLEGAVGAIGGVLAQIVAEVAGAAPAMIDAAVQLLSALLQGLRDNAENVASSATNIVTSLVNGLLSLAPQLLDTSAQLLAAFGQGLTAALPSLLPQAAEMVTSLAQRMAENLPTMLVVATQLIQGFAEGLSAALPILLEALPTIISGLVNGIVSSLPQIIQVGIQLFSALVGALPEIVAAIVEALPTIIGGITQAVVDNLPTIIEAGVQLFGALVTNLPQIIAAIIAVVPDIVSALVNALVEGFTGAAEAIVDIGSNIVSGIWEGICGAADWLKEQVKGFFTGIVDGAKSVLGIHSPSTVFASIGKYSMEGLAQGINESKDEAAKSARAAVEAAGKAAEGAIPSLKPGFEVAVSANTAGLYQRMQGVVESESALVSNRAAARATPDVLSGETRRQASVDGASQGTQRVEIGFAEDPRGFARYMHPYIKEADRLGGVSLVKGAGK